MPVEGATLQVTPHISSLLGLNAPRVYMDDFV